MLPGCRTARCRGSAEVDALGVDASLELGASLFGLDGDSAHAGLQLAAGAYLLASTIYFTLYNICRPGAALLSEC